MPYAPEHKERTRERIVGAAARLFNKRGFAEVSIGEIMTAAGLTHGGFYRHFNSKEALYAEVVRHFLRKEVPERWQKGQTASCPPDQAFARFVVDAYLSQDHLEDVEGSCPLVGLASDVARSAGGVKAAYREVAQAMVEVFRANMKGRGARDQAMVLVALCVGGMVLARALDDRIWPTILSQRPISRPSKRQAGEAAGRQAEAQVLSCRQYGEAACSLALGTGRRFAPAYASSAFGSWPAVETSVPEWCC